MTELQLYASRGWRCVPILPGTKRPAWNDWPRRATADIAELEAWWAQHPDHGIGIATGAGSGFFVLDIDPRNGGDETMHDLEMKHGALSGNCEVLTGGGGRHLYFRWPPVGTVHAGILGPGIDIKSEGGQVLAPPTIHPDTGQRYELELGGAEFPLDAPRWLLDLVGSDARAPVATETVPREILAQSPAAWDRFNAAASNELTASFMEEMGWTILGTDRKGVITIQRPDLYAGEGKEGTSMTVGAITGAPGVAFCWTSSVPGWANEHPYDAAEVMARARYGGDLAATDKMLAEAGWGIRSHYDNPDQEVETYAAQARMMVQFAAPDEHDPWGDLDIARALTEPPVMPSMYQRSDGICLLYPSSVHWVTAHPETGKTWLALHMVAQALEKGMHVTFLDYENGLPLLERLIHLRVSKERLIRQLHLKSMPSSWVDAQHRILADVQGTGSRMVVVDSCQSCMASAGLDPVVNYDFLKFYDFSRRLTIGGAAVVVLDHLRKQDKATERFPMGAGQKLAQSTVNIALQKRAQFAPGRIGEASLIVHKDRHGSVRKECDQVNELDMIGTFQLASDGLTGDCEAAFKPYHETSEYVESAPIEQLPYTVMQSVTDLLVTNGDLQQLYLESMVKAPREEVKVAILELERRGFVEMINAQPKVWHVLRPYRTNHDPLSPYYTGEQE